jgi:hypothetical protein
MQSWIKKPTSVQWMYSVAMVLGVLYWLGAYLIRDSNLGITVWSDQFSHFMAVDITMPPNTIGFLPPPHTAILLYPLTLLPRYFAIFVQMLLLCAVLVAIIQHLPARNRWLTFWVVFLSPFMLDNAIELNIEWLVAVSFLVPPAYSAIFVLTKPQIMLTYPLSFSWKNFVRFIMVSLLVVLGSFLLWGDWITPWLLNREIKGDNQLLINVAPLHIMGVVPAVVCGLALLAWAWYKRDMVWITVAGLFFVPYIAFYSLIIPFVLIATRRPWLSAVVSVCLWILLITAVLASLNIRWSL